MDDSILANVDYFLHEPTDRENFENVSVITPHLDSVAKGILLLHKLSHVEAKVLE